MTAFYDDHTPPAPLPCVQGAITAGYSTDAADAAIQANIVAAGYGR